MENEQNVIVASVELTRDESLLISAYAKLAGIRVKDISSALVKEFIKQHVSLQLLKPPTEQEYKDVVSRMPKIEYKNGKDE